MVVFINYVKVLLKTLIEPLVHHYMHSSCIMYAIFKMTALNVHLEVVGKSLDLEYTFIYLKVTSLVPLK